MAKGRLEFNTFVKGLVTEAGPLTYPEGASREEKNFVLNRDGSRQRRFGLDFEEGAVFTDSIVNPAQGKLTSHKWTNPGNAGGFEVTVIQDANKFYFYNSNASSLSASPLNGGVAITLNVGYVDIVANTADINGKLYVTGATQAVTEFTFDPSTESVTSRNFNIKSRDLWGIDDGQDVDERNGGITPEHEYNLRNQGWPDEFKCATNNEGDNAILTDPVTYTFSTRGIYPSNADPITFYKLTAPADPDANNSYSPWALDEFVSGSSQVPKGNTILDQVWNRGYERSLVTAGVPADQSTGAIVAVGAFAGRLFYGFRQDSQIGGDERSPNLSTTIMYSQVGVDNADKCYSQNDQSAEDFNDLLDTDGGFISLPEMGQLLRMVAMGDSLYFIATNGVWAVSGGDTGFSATNQKIDKITNVGAIGIRSIVVAEDSISYWSKGGIYLITLDEVSLSGKAKNATQATIQSLYDAIPATARSQAVGVYDETSRQLRWLYRDVELPIDSLFNKELILDLNLGAFYENKFEELGVGSDAGVWLSGYVDVADVIILTGDEDVTDQGVVVTDQGVDVTNSVRTITESTRGSTKYVCTVGTLGLPFRFTFAQLKNPDFQDWPTVFGGVDSPASLLTGYWTGDVSTKDKRIPYLWIHFRRTEQGFIESEDGLDMIGQSSCIVQAQWEWTDSVNAGKWGVEFQGYKLPRSYMPLDVDEDFDFGYTVVTTKNKVRGSGPALSLNFTSEPGRDCHIYGWALEVDQEET